MAGIISTLDKQERACEDCYWFMRPREFPVIAADPHKRFRTFGVRIRVGLATDLYRCHCLGSIRSGADHVPPIAGNTHIFVPLLSVFTYWSRKPTTTASLITVLIHRRCLKVHQQDHDIACSTTTRLFVFSQQKLKPLSLAGCNCSTQLRLKSYLRLRATT